MLAATAATIGTLHTLLGPDHYLPFIAMARARRWSIAKTIYVTLACGSAHVASSVVLGLAGILAGWSVGSLNRFEGTRGELAAWLLLGFGLAYTIWGLRRAIRKQPHTHWHTHVDGTRHRHEHTHDGEHLQVHSDEFAPDLATPERSITPWMLFTVFLFGPCEPLIPILMYPAAERSWGGLVMITAVFSACTLATMLATVVTGYYGLSAARLGRLERYSHALAGLALMACGLGMRLGA